MIRIPFSRNKRYLTGMDWLVHTFDYMTSQATGVGNLSQIVLELSSSPAEDEIRKYLTDFVEKYPVVNGWPKRDYNLAPYWKIHPRARKVPLSISVSRLGIDMNAVNVLPILEQGVNMSFNSIREHLAFHLVCSEEKSFLAMTFDHRLFDASGAEAFLAMFQQEWEERSDYSQDIVFSEPAHLCRWREKFEAGKRVNRTFLRLAENAPPRVFPLSSVPNDRGFRFKLIPFNEQQTATIIETAYNETGYLLLMPYILAVSIKVLHGIFTGRSIEGGDYIIPVTIDMRPLAKIREELFFNHMSFFLFQIKAEEADSFPILLEAIKQQMYDQVKSGLPRDISQVAFLMRIVPLPALSYLIRLYLKGQIASSCFAYLGETAYTFSRFMEEEVNNLFHMPRAPVPPGLGIFFNQFQGKLNAVLSYIEGILSEDEIEEIANNLRIQLGSG